MTNLPTTIEDCVFWGNRNQNGTSLNAFQIRLYHAPGGAEVLISHSTLELGLNGIYNFGPGVVTWGPGNLELDPAFADPDGPDGNPDTVLDNDYRLDATSSCIDAGDNAPAAGILVDLDGNPRFVDDPNVADTGSGTAPLIDMGCYERP